MTNQQQPYGQPQQDGQRPQYGQAQYGQAQYGQQPQQAMHAAQGFIDLTVQGSALTSNMIPPSVTIDGHPIQTGYGSTVIPVPAGQHTVHAQAQWLKTYGKADLTFTVQPGQHVPVFYVSPYHQFSSGSIGHEKQKRKGLLSLIGIMVAVIVVIFLLSLLSALGN